MCSVILTSSLTRLSTDVFVLSIIVETATRGSVMTTSSEQSHLEEVDPRGTNLSLRDELEESGASDSGLSEQRSWGSLTESPEYETSQLVQSNTCLSITQEASCTERRVSVDGGIRLAGGAGRLGSPSDETVSQTGTLPPPYQDNW